MIHCLVGQRPPMAIVRVAAASLADSAVWRNPDVLTRCPGPSAPPDLANRYVNFAAAEDHDCQSSDVIINLGHDLVNHQAKDLLDFYY